MVKALRWFQSQLKLHHKRDPILGSLPQRSHDPFALVGLDAIVSENLAHFASLRLGNRNYFLAFTYQLVVIVLGIATRGEIPAQSHRDGTGRDLGKPSRDDQPVFADRACQASSQCKRHREPVRHTDDDVAHGVAGLEMQFVVVMIVVERHDEDQDTMLMHGSS
jgi:hypothetical protein